MNNHSSLQRCFADALAALVFHSQLPPEEVVADDVTRTYTREKKQFLFSILFSFLLSLNSHLTHGSLIK